MEDNMIIDLLFDRNENAIAALEAKYGNLLKRLSSNILKNEEDSKECVNDTYLGAWNAIPPARPSSLSAFLCKIARNLSIKRYHHNTASKRNSYYDVALSELDECLADTRDVESEAEAGALTKDLENFLDLQSAEDRVVFLERYYFSAPYSEIAKKTGLTEKNVSVRLTRIRKKLKTYLCERGYSL